MATIEVDDADRDYPPIDLLPCHVEMVQMLKALAEVDRARQQLLYDLFVRPIPSPPRFVDLSMVPHVSFRVPWEPDEPPIVRRYWAFTYDPNRHVRPRSPAAAVLDPLTPQTPSRHQQHAPPLRSRHQ